MDIQFYGANCIKVSTKKAAVVFDDNLAEIGLKTVTKPQDILLLTHDIKSVPPALFVAAMPGDYEVSGIAITGIAARAHMDEEGKTSATIYKLVIDDLSLVVIGHAHPDLSEEQLEKIGIIDIMLVPVGGQGYTLDAIGTLKLIKKIEPKVVIPTHYADKAIKYEVPQDKLEEALASLAMEPAERTEKYRPKSIELSDTVKLIVLDREK